MAEPKCWSSPFSHGITTELPPSILEAVSDERVLPHLRWRGGILEQCVERTEYRDGVPWAHELHWRPVPIEEEEPFQPPDEPPATPTP